MKDYDDTRIDDTVFEEWVGMLSDRLSDWVNDIEDYLTALSGSKIALGKAVRSKMWAHLEQELDHEPFAIVKLLRDQGMINEIEADPGAWDDDRHAGDKDDAQLRFYDRG